MTADQFEAIVLRLARWGWARYWLHHNYPVTSPWLMAVQVLGIDGKPIKIPHMDEYGFEWRSPLYIVERHDDDGKPYGGKS
jgi:hypothetical protein